MDIIKKLFWLVFALPAAVGIAAEPEKPIETNTSPAKSTPPPDGEQNDYFIGRSRSYLGQSYIKLTHTIDGFLAGKRLEREYNDSFLKLITQSTWFEHSESSYDLKLKGKIDLPGTKQRFRLFIDSDPDISNSLEDRNRSISRGERINENTSIAGLEFGKQKPLTRWQSSFSVGAKLEGELNLLTRLRLRKHWVLNERWTSYFHQDIWYLDGTGWGETSRSEFTRSLGKKSWFKLLSEIEYQDDDPAWQYIHIWRIDQVLSKNHALTYKIGVLGETPEGIFQDNRFISFSWRSHLYDNWVFLHLTPEVYFAREDNYRSEAAFTIKLEMFLTD